MKKKTGLKYITFPYHVEGFLILDDATFGAAIKDVYLQLYGLDRRLLESDGGKCLAAHCMHEVQEGLDRTHDESERNSVKGKKSAEMRKAKKAAVNSGQPQSTTVDRSQQQPTESTDKNRIDNIKENTKETTQGELALERPTCFAFEEFWKMYGKSKRKDFCRKLWEKIPEEERQKIKEHLPRYVDANEQKFRLDPERYLKHKAWEDEIISSNPQPQAEEKIERQNDFDSWLAQEDKRRGENG